MGEARGSVSGCGGMEQGCRRGEQKEEASILPAVPGEGGSVPVTDCRISSNLQIENFIISTKKNRAAIKLSQEKKNECRMPGAECREPCAESRAPTADPTSLLFTPNHALFVLAPALFPSFPPS